MQRTTTLLFSLLICLFILQNCRLKPKDNGERPEVGIALDSLVRRVAIPSVTMGKVFNANVILPESYFKDSSMNFYPVVYLLHGYSGNYANWYDRVPELKDLSSEHELIIVTPDGNFNSWYLDSYTDSTQLFYAYISQEVPRYIDEHFRSYQDARYRGIAGLSMGGHGALSIALQHPDWFGVAGSMSGVVDLRAHTDEWEISQHLGPYAEDSTRWAEHSIVAMAEKVRETPHLLIDCGTEDQMLPENEALHQVLLLRGIPHTYIARPGSHDWLYWQEAIDYQLQFFKQRFEEG
ncbi:alpha/beta hydrolase [Lewinella sp. LCG006]|uniref:alpha/beta hydrolase n=1 Tax=Lewinella sp. LCG006 TaxID=3231911 RepID=UPI0034601AEA